MVNMVGYKLLASKAIPPDGAQTVIYRPNGQVVLSSIVLSVFWDKPKQAGFYPASEGYYRRSAVPFVKETQPYTGFPAESPNLYWSGRWNRATYYASMEKTGPQTGIETAGISGQHGVYTPFQLLVSGSPITAIETPPAFMNTYTFTGPFPLETGQPLQAINGIVMGDLGGMSEDHIRRLVQDHRARANHLNILVFGQEIPS